MEVGGKRCRPALVLPSHPAEKKNIELECFPPSFPSHWQARVHPLLIPSPCALKLGHPSISAWVLDRSRFLGHVQMEKSQFQPGHDPPTDDDDDSWGLFVGFPSPSFSFSGRESRWSLARKAPENEVDAHSLPFDSTPRRRTRPALIATDFADRHRGIEHSIAIDAAPFSGAKEGYSHFLLSIYAHTASTKHRPAAPACRGLAASYSHYHCLGPRTGMAISEDHGCPSRSHHPNTST